MEKKVFGMVVIIGQNIEYELGHHVAVIQDIGEEGSAKLQIVVDYHCLCACTNPDASQQLQMSRLGIWLSAMGKLVPTDILEE
eukprot:g22371.t1